MKLKYKTQDFQTAEVDARVVVLTDSEGNEYRINLDKERGLEILVENGRAEILPKVSNHLTLATKN